MCRLLGVVSHHPASMSALLADHLTDFVALSQEHAHGWGISTWHDTLLTTVKDIEPAHASPTFPAATSTVTDAGILHLRKATPPLAVDVRNTHPFVAGTHAFAHNGYFLPFTAIDDLIDPDLLAAASGDTDSERYFLRIRTLLRDHEPATAIALAAADIRARATFASLNCLLLTDDALYAYSEEDPAAEIRRRRGPDFFRMRYHLGADRVVIASSGIPQPEETWHILPYHHVLEIRRTDLHVHLHTPPALLVLSGTPGLTAAPGDQRQESESGDG